MPKASHAQLSGSVSKNQIIDRSCLDKKPEAGDLIQNPVEKVSNKRQEDDADDSLVFNKKGNHSTAFSLPSVGYANKKGFRSVNGVVCSEADVADFDFN